MYQCLAGLVKYCLMRISIATITIEHFFCRICKDSMISGDNPETRSMKVKTNHVSVHYNDISALSLALLKWFFLDSFNISEISEQVL